jgi:hypothetical protein
MEALFHLVFEFTKISILSSIYASILLFTFRIIATLKPNNWVDKISKEKSKFWVASGLIISIMLFLFMFSYYGNHGLGDSARVPVGYDKAIEQINGTQAYIQDEGPVSALDIDKFILTGKFVYGKTGEQNENYTGKYFTYDIVNNQVKIFENENIYIDFLASKNLETNPEYKDFNYYYSKYWNGWRFWTLP